MTNRERIKINRNLFKSLILGKKAEIKIMIIKKADEF